MMTVAAWRRAPRSIVGPVKLSTVFDDEVAYFDVSSNDRIAFSHGLRSADMNGL